MNPKPDLQYLAQHSGPQERDALCELVAAFPLPIRVDTLMRSMGFNSARPDDFIRFCVIRARLNHQLRPTGWTVSRSGGTSHSYSALVPIQGAHQ